MDIHRLHKVVRGKRILGQLPLRHRFMVSPILALLLIGILTAGFAYQASRQAQLLERIAREDLAEYDRCADVLNSILVDHMSLYRVLHDARRTAVDQASGPREEARQHLSRIRIGVDALATIGDTGSDDARVLAVYSQSYLRTTSAIVDMASVDIGHAAGMLIVANDRFGAMNHAFEDYLDKRRDTTRREIADQVRQGQAASWLGAALGLGTAGLLLALSFALSRLLSRSLERHIGTLNALTREAGTVAQDPRGDEVQRLTQAIDAFSASLLSLREKERALVGANEALERRVDERTSALRQSNDELRGEVALRREAERYLRTYSEVIRSTGEAVIITDLSGLIMEVNPAYEYAVGRSSSELVGQRMYERDGDAQVGAPMQDVWRSLHAEGRWTGEVLDRRSNGELFPAWTQVNLVGDETGTPARYVWISRDITAIKRSEQQLQRLAFYDPLTELPNRALFADRLQVALASARRQRSKVGVMYIDLDHFKDVNDTLGHPAGDRLLVEVAKRVGGCIRAVDTAARMGGDEFTVLLAQLDDERDALRVAERIVAALQAPVMLGEQQVHVGASIGLSFYPKDGADAQTLQKHADLAMYEAKNAGRGTCRAYSADMAARGSDRVSLNLALEAALDNDEFTLAYQPIICSANGDVTKVEALIRWVRPNGEFVSPAVFIPRAEESGLIRRIDRWVIERACRDASSWHAQGRDLSVCVNLSALSVQESDLAASVGDILRRTQLPPERLIVEITETAMVADPYAARRALEALMATGVGVSLDDFGTGYASLSYLTLFPINCIKLDRSFVERIGKDRASEEVIRSVLDLANKLGLDVVAEGIEEQEQQAFLHGAGCAHLQGFHLGKPMSNEQLGSWLGERFGEGQQRVGTAGSRLSEAEGSFV